MVTDGPRQVRPAGFATTALHWIARLMIRGRGSDFFWGDIEERYGDRYQAEPLGDHRGWYRRELCAAVVAWWSVESRRARGRVRVRGDVRGLGSGWLWGDGILGDVRVAARALKARPWSSALAIGTLAIGIGVNGAVFSLVDGILLERLPYRDPDGLFRVTAVRGDDPPGDLTYLHLAALREAGPMLDGTAAYSRAVLPLTGASEPEEIELARVSDGFFELLGVRPALGRTFAPEEIRDGQAVVVLSYAIWTRRFGSDPDVLGRRVAIDEVPHTIIGVAPSAVALPAWASLWRPLQPAETEDDDPEFEVLARGRAGADAAGVSAALGAATQAYVDGGAAEAAKGLKVIVTPAQDFLVAAVRPALWSLWVAALMVAFVASLNVALLMLVRGESRAGENALRAAIGASRGTLVRSAFMESALLAVIGGALGIGLGYVALPAVVALAPAVTPRLSEISMDGRVVGAMCLLSAIVALVFGTLPSIRAGRVEPARALAGSGSRTVTGGRASRIMVFAQVAASTGLVLVALLLSTTFVKLTTFDRGYDEDQALVLELSASSVAGQHEGGLEGFFDQVLAEVRSIPGIQSASLTSHTPDVGRGLSPGMFQFSGFDVDVPDRVTRGGVVIATSGYLSTVGVDIVEGRDFDDGDRPDTEAVAIVSESFALAYLPEAGRGGRSVVGRTFTRRSFRGGERVPVRIVGIAADVRPDPRAPAPELIYLPNDQIGFRGDLVIRASGPVRDYVPAIRERIWALDPNVPFNGAYTLGEAASKTADPARFQATVLGLFSALGLLMAGVGIYGVSAQSVVKRTREIGIRRALGAQAGSIRGHIFGEVAGVTLAGIAVGVTLGTTVMMGMKSLLFGVEPLSVPLVTGVAVLLLATAVAAAAPSALRAIRIDPMEALRSEG